MKEDEALGHSGHRDGTTTSDGNDFLLQGEG